jgi:hypothetical protein
MEDINDYVFSIKGNWLFQFEIDEHETTPYDVAWHTFVTDYDRENPVTKKKAIPFWIKENIHQNKHKVLGWWDETFWHCFNRNCKFRSINIP